MNFFIPFFLNLPSKPPSKRKFFLYLLKKREIMPDNFFEESTAAVGTIFTIIALGILVSILIWG